MAAKTKKAIMCLSALLFLRAFRALLSILLRGASSSVVGTSRARVHSVQLLSFSFKDFLLISFGGSANLAKYLLFWPSLHRLEQIMSKYWTISKIVLNLLSIELLFCVTNKNC